LLEFTGDSYINSNCRITCCKHIKIGKGVFVSWDVQIFDSDFHSISYESEKSENIEIGDNVWIGSRATILKGVKIGAGSVIASGAVITKDTPEHCLVAGIPGQVIKNNIYWKQ
jgi:acetyltransferase-like isoleucine patch superfamily enzyme